MKKEDIPQDKGHLKDFTREVFYAKNEKGEYEASLSEGWDVKNQALDYAWKDIEEKVTQAKEDIKNGKVSPIKYFMELNVMDFSTLSAYTGIWTFFIKRHFKPSVFKNLSDKTLNKYAKAFDITIKELKDFGKHDK